MIVAGIDEAGYGPVLGPLVVGTCAFEIEGELAAGPPCFWKLLRKVVSKNRVRDGKRLHINDSKLVYSTAAGLKELERSVLTVATCVRDLPAGLEQLLGQVAPDVLADMARYPWYQTSLEVEKFPLEQDAISLRMFANALRAEMTRVKTRCVHLAARVVCEGELNRMFDATRNKSNVLFSLAATHLDYLLRTFGGQNLIIICDRQGGRGHYGPLLRLMFDEWNLEIVSEVESRSDYRLLRGNDAVSITFVEKAETGCLPVAMASMLSKYLRECMMERFNGYWRRQMPGVIRTAGYYTDGVRFLGDIQQKRRELGVADAQLIRSR